MELGPWTIDYAALAKKAESYASYDEIAALFAEELPHTCRDAYIAASKRPSDIVRIPCGSFEYIYDEYTSFERHGVIEYSAAEEGRVIVACGYSVPPAGPRDDYRLRKLAGSTEVEFGKRWDKGHFIGHTLGGIVGGFEANVFLQRRELNRGWSTEGKLYREMETYCATNPGTFCFTRPIYFDGTARPTFLDFGLIKTDRELWVECFDNQEASSK